MTQLLGRCIGECRRNEKNAEGIRKIMKKKTIAAIIILLAVAAAVLGIYNRNASGTAKEGLTVIAGGKETVISWEEIGSAAFEGDIVNGKGESKHHSFEGAELAVLLRQAKIDVTAESKITAASEDNYSAELSGAEVLEPGKVWVALSADGEALEGIEGGQGAQLIVFGDSNSKRAVRYLKTFTIE